MSARAAVGSPSPHLKAGTHVPAHGRRGLRGVRGLGTTPLLRKGTWALGQGHTAQAHVQRRGDGGAKVRPGPGSWVSTGAPTAAAVLSAPRYLLGSRLGGGGLCGAGLLARGLCSPGRHQLCTQEGAAQGGGLEALSQRAGASLPESSPPGTDTGEGMLPPCPGPPAAASGCLGSVRCHRPRAGSVGSDWGVPTLLPGSLPGSGHVLVWRRREDK